MLARFPQLRWVVLRPPAVYGPGDKEMLAIFQWMRRGIALNAWDAGRFDATVVGGISQALELLYKLKKDL